MRLAASAHHVMMPSSSYLVRYYYRSICDTKVSLRGGIGQQQLKRENTNPFTVLLWMKDNHRGGSRTIHDPANHSTVPTTTLGMLLRWLDHRSLRVVVGQATTRTSRWNPHILMTVLVSKKKTWSNQQEKHGRDKYSAYDAWFVAWVVGSWVSSWAKKRVILLVWSYFALGSIVRADGMVTPHSHCFIASIIK